jgi:FkbM family methyltransferase
MADEFDRSPFGGRRPRAIRRRIAPNPIIRGHHVDSFRAPAGTQDAEIFREVVELNTYGLPGAFRGDEVIVDIGANVGAFTYAVLIRGAREVHAFEADRGNYECAARNPRDFGDRVRLHHAAVWRSDRRDRVIHFNFLGANEARTGCGHVLDTGRGQSVRAEPLDDVIRAIARGGGRIDLLKIDCEGSEYPILLTPRRLHRVDRIIGEFHNFASGTPEWHLFSSIPERARVPGYDRFTDAELIPFLARRGYDLTVRRHVSIPHLQGVFDAVCPARRWRGSRPRGRTGAAPPSAGAPERRDSLTPAHIDGPPPSVPSAILEPIGRVYRPAESLTERAGVELEEAAGLRRDPDRPDLPGRRDDRDGCCLGLAVGYDALAL